MDEKDQEKRNQATIRFCEEVSWMFPWTLTAANSKEIITGDNLEDSKANDGQKVTVLQRIPLMN